MNEVARLHMHIEGIGGVIVLRNVYCIYSILSPCQTTRGVKESSVYLLAHDYK